ncbi:MAG TPA: hypothetical protein VMH24_05670 [Candidatus Sulfotelmatobacter sp.]|nr:hypothetical protein [Candidatus Sulfotelmatobacter sp.]
MSASAGPAARRDPAGPDVPGILAGLCPYLLAEGGAWRSARPAAEHRCHAVRPPAALTGDQQRRLCLVREHAACPTFLDARQRHEQALVRAGVHLDRLAGRRTTALTRPIPVILDRAFSGPRAPSLTGRTRRLAELGLVLVMLLAAALVLAARFAGLGLLGAS